MSPSHLAADLPTGSSSHPRTRFSQWGVPIAVFVAGALVSLAVFSSTRSRERAARRLELEREAAQLTRSAQASFDVPLEVVRSIPAMFEASDDVTRAEFRTFVSSALARYPWIYALEWVPRVPAEERAKWEAAADADGLDGYHFKQDAPAGLPVRAEPRAEYYPLYYMEPPNPIALGIEETALSARKNALERARDLDATVMSERLKLVQDPPAVWSVIAFHPMYKRGERPATVEARRESLRGFAAAVFRIRPVLQRALQSVHPERLDIVVFDAEAQPEALLYESRPGAAEAVADKTAAPSEHLIAVAGRRWAVRVGDRGNWLRAEGIGWTALGLGLVASALAAALAWAFEATTRLRRQVDAAKRLGQYTLVERLGEGGMGTVYRAHHAVLRRPTAIKLLHSTRTDAQDLARFESEVQLTSSLTHPNTVVVYDYGHTPEGVFYYAMEYIEGITLQELVDIDGPQPPERVVHVLTQACDALAEAHGVGLVHRDIKPANIMLCRRGGIDDFVKVLDFGLAKDLTEEARGDLSQSAVLVGTPLYVAPEVAMHKPIDARVDLYALGAVAYFMLTGTPVFKGSTVLELCVKHLSSPPEPPSERLGRELPAGLEALVMQCLEKEPDARPQSAAALATSLRALDLPEWTSETARRWWAEEGRSVDERVRAARKAAEKEPSGRTLVIGGPRRAAST